MENKVCPTCGRQYTGLENYCTKMRRFACKREEEKVTSIRLFGIAGDKEQDFSLLGMPTKKIKERK